MISQAVILSAGLGTRLRPLTDKIPKVMIPIAGKPLLEHNIEQFGKYGVSEFFINLHYMPEVIKNYFGDGSKWGVKIKYHYEPELLGTAGGIKSFESYLDDEFFAIYGDIFSKVDYAKFYQYWKTKTDAIGIQRIGDTGNPWDKDLVEVDDDLRFLKIYPKPHKELPHEHKGMRGIFILKKKILSYIPPNTYYEIGSQLLPDILSRGEKFYGYECDDYSIGVDTKEAYEKIQQKL
jgi:NDP-sugar pyrophosphorylase family protein